MSRRTFLLVAVVALAVLAALGSAFPSQADSAWQPSGAGSPLDLVHAVNALRASHGRAPYSTNSILMSTAQGQADYMAAAGVVTHTGPGGIGVTDRLLAAGYPLAGDLSLGGWRSENITRGPESMSAQAAVEAWTGDAEHLNTMIAAELTEIGAGVAVSGGRVYYVIDAARPTTSTAPQAGSTSVAGGSSVPASEAAVVIPVALSTPNENGDLIHEVQAGQSLWQIAIAYQVKIDDIKGLNGLTGNDIYPGDKLVIKKGVTVATASPTESPTQATSTPTAFATVTAPPSLPVRATATAAVLAASTSPSNSTIMKVFMGLIALALAGGGLLGWISGQGKRNPRGH